MKQEYRPGDVLQIGADGDIPEYRVISTVKSVPDEFGRYVTMYGFTAFWDRELEHEKFSNTSRLPNDRPIRIIGFRPVKQ